MRLTKKQKKFVLACVAEGLETPEINQRASRQKPPFEVSRQQVDFYRDSRGVRIEELKAADEVEALSSGFALRDERVRVLSQIAQLLHSDLSQAIRSLEDGEFKEGEIRQLRGVFDDLAKEMGDRKTKLEHSSEDDKPLKILVEYEDAD
jgi:predicted RNase H-like nuclease (RuvC/YqgF family)